LWRESPAYIFNFDASLIKDDIGAEDAFLEVLREGHLNSKVEYSLMFSCNAAGEILSPMVVYCIGILWQT
jgi:hypothetical protein